MEESEVLSHEANQPDEAPTPVETGKQRSTIRFPYGDLGDAVAVARAVYAEGDSVEPERLAPALNHTSTSSGTFLVKVAASQIFGLVERDNRVIRLTDRGRNIVNPATNARAMAEAFYGVELYRRICDEFRGQPLPPDSGLEKFMIRVGVAEKQVGKARQAMKRSAEQAGFFEMGKDRLVAPKILNSPPPNAPPATNVELPERPEPEVQIGRSGGLGFHPAVEGMLVGLPKEGTTWTKAEQAEWIAAFSKVLALFHVRDDPPPAKAKPSPPQPSTEQSGVQAEKQRRTSADLDAAEGEFLRSVATGD